MKLSIVIPALDDAASIVATLTPLAPSVAAATPGCVVMACSTSTPPARPGSSSSARASSRFSPAAARMMAS